MLVISLSKPEALKFNDLLEEVGSKGAAFGYDATVVDDVKGESEADDVDVVGKVELEMIFSCEVRLVDKVALCGVEPDWREAGSLFLVEPATDDFTSPDAP